LNYLSVEDIALTMYSRGAKIVPAKDLKKLGVVETYHHSVGYDCLFAPSVQDVLEQIPATINGEDVVGFKLNPKFPLVYDMDVGIIKSKTVLYGLKEGAEMPEELANEDVVVRGQKYTAKEIDEMTL